MKFCKCAQGDYGYQSYSSTKAKKTAYQYVDPADNLNWAVTAVSTSSPVKSVKCVNGVTYSTGQDYYR